MARQSDKYNFMPNTCDKHKADVNDYHKFLSTTNEAEIMDEWDKQTEALRRRFNGK